MIKNVIETLGGMDVYGIISVRFFLRFFTGMLFWAFRLKNSYLNSMRELPLDDGAVRTPKPNSSRNPTLAMNDKDNPLMMDHEADGIRELDNKLPRWWVWLLTSPLFSGRFTSRMITCSRRVTCSEGADGNRVSGEMKIGDAIKGKSISRSSRPPSPRSNRRRIALAIAAGKTTFVAKCAPCHRLDAGGLVGRTSRTTIGFTGRSFPTTCDDLERREGERACWPERNRA